MGSEGTCPLGGLWYTCTAQTPTFFGCCTSNPCNGVGCPASDLRAAGMGTGAGPDFSSNDSSFFPNVQCSVGQWWTCASQSPSFQGCCESNPCQGSGTGCPAGKLHPAAFKTIPTLSGNTYIPTATSSIPLQSTVSVIVTLSTTVVSTSTTSRATSTPTAAPLPPATTTSYIPAIAGGAVGGVVMIALLAFIYYCYRRRQSKNPNKYSKVNEHSYMTPESIGKYSPSPPYQQYQSPAVHEIGSSTVSIVESSPGLGIRDSVAGELEDTSSTLSSARDTGFLRLSELPDTQSLRGPGDSPHLGEEGLGESKGDRRL